MTLFRLTFGIWCVIQITIILKTLMEQKYAQCHFKQLKEDAKEMKRKTLKAQDEQRRSFNRN